MRLEETGSKSKCFLAVMVNDIFWSKADAAKGDERARRICYYA
jgi:hypothetical protein